LNQQNNIIISHQDYTNDKKQHKSSAVAEIQRDAVCATIVSSQYTCVTDRHTDRQTSHNSKHRAMHMHRAVKTGAKLSRNAINGQTMETGHPSTRAVNSGSGNRALVTSANAFVVGPT